MAHEIQYMFKSKRFVWIMAAVFGVVIMFQYFEFPYGGVVSSLLTAGSPQPPSSSPASLTPPTMMANTIVSAPLKTSLNKPINVSAPNLDHNFKEQSEVSGQKPFVSADNSSTKVIPTVRKSHMRPLRDTVTIPVMHDNSLTKMIPTVRKSHMRPLRDTVTIPMMHNILLHNRASVHSMKPRWSSMVDQELLYAKSQIENAGVNDMITNDDPSIYRNISRFKSSYKLMEKTLKVYIYKEGEKPIFHQPEPVLSGIYASEGWFMRNIQESRHFVTKNPKKAHLFYIPFSSRILELNLYVPGSHSKRKLVQYLKNYIDMIAGRYNFWNRTGGSDHFVVACHDWATYETRKSMDSCIRALCNSDVNKEYFELGKDVSLPETLVRSSKNPLRELGGKPPSQRSVLAFFAGRMHGNLRPILLKHWENKDPDMKIFGKLQKNNTSYVEYMKSSKYCICAKGYEVNSPRVVEAIFHECVPVIISDNFVPPFFEILNWESFSVFVQEKDIPNLKNILLAISYKRYRVMQARVKKVQKHFLWHVKPVKYDVFHMILHSIWYNRVFRVNPII
ncbi:exostosin family protein [Artemisia annua]|uniref:Exostosin family protein n=1 Tax=Artemisia annua TaxID=35608 RepID=A0A2U1MNR3_ARTAN|nr:exostosin family protein [Artemisia annua]